MKKFLIFVCLLAIAYPKYKVAIAMQFKNEEHYIEEWVQYHMLVGIDHFYLYNDASTDNTCTILKPYIDMGIVELFDSPKVSPMELSWEPRQLASYYDAVKRAKGNAEWIALIDSDEILVPMKNTSLPKTVSTYFKHADGVYVNWRNFGTSKKGIPKGKPLFTELTHCTHRKHSRNWIGKSLLRPEAVDVSEMFDYVHFFKLLPGKKFIDGDGTPANIEGGLYKTRMKHSDQYLRINHYALRDENYFWEVRMNRDNYGYGDNDGSRKLFHEHYKSFNVKQDNRVLKIIRQKKHLIVNPIWDRN